MSIFFTLAFLISASYVFAAPPASGDWEVNGTEVYENTTIVITGNMYVRAGDDLTLRNATLIINSSSDGQYIINVEKGGRLTFFSSTIRPLTTNLRYQFNVYGALTIKNSTIMNTYSGIRIYSYNELFGSQNPVLIDSNVVVCSSGSDGIYVQHTDQTRQNADVTISNNRITGCNGGMSLQYADSPIINNTIYSNSNGIYLSYSNPTIINNSIYSNYNGLYLGYSSPVVDASRITNNNYNVYVSNCYNCNPTIKNSVITPSTYNDVYAHPYTSSISITLLNTTFDKNKVSLPNPSTSIIVHWKLDAKVVDVTDNPVQDATVMVYDKYGQVAFSGTTDNTGYVHAILTDYIQNNLNTKSFNPYTIVATKASNQNYTVTNVTSNGERIIKLIGYTSPPEFRQKPPLAGLWEITGTESYSNAAYVLTGSIVIREGGSLILNNITLILDGFYNGELSITVEKGGQLMVANSIINSMENNIRYNFYVYGTLTIKNSTIMNTYSGIRIYSYNEFMGSQNPVLIDGNVIRGTGSGDGIYIEHNSQTRQNIDITISNNTIIQNGNGISLSSTDPLIVNNTIASNSNGIYLYYSNPRIEGNFIYSNTQSGIYAATSSRPTVSRNNVVNNYQNVVSYGYAGESVPTVENSVITPSTYKDISLSYSGDIILINTTFDKNKVYFSGSDTVATVKWNLDLRVIDNETDSVPSVNVLIKDKSGAVVVNFITGRDGRYLGMLTEYNQTSTGTYNQTPHNITVSYKNYTNNTIVTMDSNKNIKMALSFDYVKGDVNGDGSVTAVDALMALKMAVGVIPPDFSADVNGLGYNGDGRVTAVDALIILKAAVGLISLE
ncbi:MAG: right-handed parallel beta-helix repeat-containing protein [Thaumarchaeota archaeon]|nr:right-handed parallel beta-helix repeat-containing protein [Nitrososphaerota archaeon]